MLQIQSSAPDDGRKHRPKHVELTRNNKLTCIVASCWLISQSYQDARIHEHQTILFLLAARRSEWKFSVLGGSKPSVDNRTKLKAVHFLQALTEHKTHKRAQFKKLSKQDTKFIASRKTLSFEFHSVSTCHKNHQSSLTNS